MGISAYSSTPASNTTISGINLAEGCNASGINDAIRQLMADLAAPAFGTGAASFGGTLAVTGAATLSGTLTYGGVTLTNQVTGTGKMVLSVGPTFTGTAGFAGLTATGAIAGNSVAATGQVSGATLAITGNGTIDQLGVHTVVGGWSGSSIFEALSGGTGGGAVSAYNLAAGGTAFLGRIDSTSSYFARFQYGTVGVVGSITSDGASTSYNTSSDRRLKDNIVDAPDASAVIDAMQVRSWDWKANGQHQPYGFVAQELAVLVPSAVHIGDDDPEEVTRGWAVDYAKLVPFLVKEVQALRARVAALEAGR